MYQAVHLAIPSSFDFQVDRRTLRNQRWNHREIEKGRAPKTAPPDNTIVRLMTNFTAENKETRIPIQISLIRFSPYLCTLFE